MVSVHFPSGKSFLGEVGVVMTCSLFYDNLFFIFVFYTIRTEFIKRVPSYKNVVKVHSPAFLDKVAFIFSVRVHFSSVSIKYY